MLNPRSTLLFALPALLLLGACAHGGERLDRVAISEVAERDPWEKTNRWVFEQSMKIDRYTLLPITNVYRTVIPDAPRRGISNGYRLMREPTYMANAIGQGKVKSAFRAFDRILVNGVLGLGVADHATDMGLSVQPHDFGQTLAVWGVPSGPFVMLPFLGPNTARDSIGFLVDFLFDPVDLIENRLLSREERWAGLGIRIVDIRSNLRDQGEQLLVGAADPYATTRSAWLQLRRYEIFDGNPPVDEEDDIPPPPDLPELNESGEEEPPLNAPTAAQDPSAEQKEQP